MIVVWQITERCNLSCPFCLYDKTRPGVRREACEDEVLRFADLLGQYQKNSGERVLISWIGGEPFLWKPLFSICQQLRTHHNLQFSTTTNGSSLYSELIQEQVLEYFSELTISVDGFAEQHNALRGWPNGWQQLKASTQALANKAKARNSGIKLRVNVVLMHNNMSSFPDLCRELKSWGIHEITFNQLGGRDRPEFYPQNRLLPIDVNNLFDILPPLKEEMLKEGIQLCGNSDYLRRIEASSLDTPISVNDCQLGERFIFIDEQGRLGPCNFTVANLGLKLDHLKSLGDIDGLPRKFNESRRKLSPANCQNCTSTRVFSKFGA